jgi:hypothetical protein
MPLLSTDLVLEKITFLKKTYPNVERAAKLGMFQVDVPVPCEIRQTRASTTIAAETALFASVLLRVMRIVH